MMTQCAAVQPVAPQCMTAARSCDSGPQGSEIGIRSDLGRGAGLPGCHGGQVA